MKITYYDLYLKLTQLKNSAGKTYFEEMLLADPDTNSFNEMKSGTIDLSNGYAVITMISENGKWKTYLEAAGLGTATGVATNIVLWTVFAPAGSIGLTLKGVLFVVKAGLIGAGTSGYLLSSDPNSKITYQYNPPMLYPFDDESLKKLECDSFETLS